MSVMAALNTESLPLVLLTLGDDEGDFQALYDHLEKVARQPQPEFQSLIVARSQVPKTLLRILTARIKQMPSVHLLRLGKGDANYSAMPHETGTFYVTLVDTKKEG